MKSKVAIVKATPDTVLDDIERCCALAGMTDALDKSATTILKDNISWHLPMPGANTTPWGLEGIYLALKNAGFDDIVVVENKTVVTVAEKGDRLCKFKPVFEKYKIPVLFNFKESDMKWIRIEPERQMLVLDKIFKNGIFVPDYFFGKNIVHLPTVKTHSYTVTTGAMKNAFGGLLNYKRYATHTHIHDTLVDLLAIQKQIHSGIFCLMDGTTSGSGPGPRTMTPHQTDFYLASADQVAIDAVAAKIMGFEPMNIRYIRRATEQGLGQGDVSQVEIVGDVEMAQKNLGYKSGVNFATGVGMLLWRSPLRFLQKLFFHTPMVLLFIWASETYHDKIWWKVKGKKIYDDWLKNSHWGRLFAQY